MRVPIEGVVLQMKAMHIDAVANFPFPTPPDRTALKRAEALLTNLGALGFLGGAPKSATISQGRMTIGGHITDLGKAMALFPVSPRFSKMLVAARSSDVLPYVISIVAALSVGDPFLHENHIHYEETSSDEKADSDQDEAMLPAELEYIKNPELRAREMRKIERQKFFKMQHVRAELFGSLLFFARLIDPCVF